MGGGRSPRRVHTRRAWDEMFVGARRARVRTTSRCTRSSARSRATTSRCGARLATAPSTTRASRSPTPARSGRSRSTSCPAIIAADEWAVVEARRAPAGARARALPRRRLRARARSCADGVVPRRLVVELVALPPLRRRARPRRRRARARRRASTSCATRAGQLPGARGQPAHAVGHLVRRREPAGDDPRVPRAVRQPPHPPGRRLPAAAARGVPRHRAAGRRRPVRGRAHARRPQRRVLRALVPRPPDGRRAGRGPRPRVPRPARLHAHDRGRAARRRRVPPRRRRVPRSAALPARLDARLRRASSTRRAPAT